MLTQTCEKIKHIRMTIISVIKCMITICTSEKKISLGKSLERNYWQFENK